MDILAIMILFFGASGNQASDFFWCQESPNTIMRRACHIAWKR